MCIRDRHKGIYLYDKATGDGPSANLLASGVGMQSALKARDILRDDYGVSLNLFSVTSWSELARDGRAKDRVALRDPSVDPEKAFVTEVLEKVDGPYIGVSDFECAVPDSIRTWVPGEYTVLGADGFGFSDTREGARRYFNIDGESITVAVLSALAREGKVDREVAVQAAKDMKITDATATYQGATQDH